jgi:hypothetical protein
MADKVLPQRNSSVEKNAAGSDNYDDKSKEKGEKQDKNESASAAESTSGSTGRINSGFQDIGQGKLYHSPSPSSQKGQNNFGNSRSNNFQFHQIFKFHYQEEEVIKVKVKTNSSIILQIVIILHF